MTAAFTPPAGKDILGPPARALYLVFAEAWERFSYYGMQALLVLYLTQYLLLPEHRRAGRRLRPFQPLPRKRLYGDRSPRRSRSPPRSPASIRPASI